MQGVLIEVLLGDITRSPNLNTSRGKCKESWFNDLMMKSKVAAIQTEVFANHLRAAKETQMKIKEFKDKDQSKNTRC